MQVQPGDFFMGGSDFPVVGKMRLEVLVSGGLEVVAEDGRRIGIRGSSGQFKVGAHAIGDAAVRGGIELLTVAATPVAGASVTAIAGTAKAGTGSTAFLFPDEVRVPESIGSVDGIGLGPIIAEAMNVVKDIV